MAFPRYDIAQRSEREYVLARTERDDVECAPDEITSACEIIGVFESETEARLQLLKLLATPAPPQPSVREIAFAH